MKNGKRDISIDDNYSETIIDDLNFTNVDDLPEGGDLNTDNFNLEIPEKDKFDGFSMIDCFGSRNTISGAAETGVMTQEQGQIIPTISGLESLMIPICFVVLIKTLMQTFEKKAAAGGRLHARHWAVT